MIDIHNENQVLWRKMSEAMQDEIIRQESCGAIIEWIGFNGWRETNTPAAGRSVQAYRIRPGTEVPPLSTRPNDEMDLTQLCKPFMALHPETVAALKAWEHGVEFLFSDGEWFEVCEEIRSPGACYRAMPVPKPNLIEREGSSWELSSLTLIALIAAHALIQTMQGGDPKLRAAYDDAIK